MTLPSSAPHPPDPLPRAAALAGLVVAWLVSVSFLAVGLLHRHLPLGLAACGLFTLYFGLGAARTLGRPGLTGLAALPWLVFGAPLVALLMAVRPGAGLVDLIGLRELAQVGATLALAHGMLLYLAARGRTDGAAGDSGTAAAARVTRVMALFIGVTWALASHLLVARFHLYQTAGHPEDTAFLWDCFRNWRAGQGVVSPWAVAWGHHYPTHYFALHFSPGLYAFFGVAWLLPRLATLLVLQNIVVFLGFMVMARALARPGGAPAPLFPGATIWTLALLLASPPLNSALRTDLHPILWSLPFVGLLHMAYDRRWPVRFLLAGLLLFTLREDLGWVWGMYAPLAWLEGRRRGRDAFWLVTPLIGFVGTIIIQQAVIPRFGVGEGAFFQMVFGTETRGLVAFLISLLGQPSELFGRLLRGGNLVLLARLLATGVAWPVGTWRWLPALTLAAIFSLVEPGTQLLRLSGHYVTVPALYLLVGGLSVLLPRLSRWDPPRRCAALVLLWALALCQPAPPELPTLDALRHVKRTREQVAEDVALIDPNRPAWLPGNLLLAAPRPELAVPIHRMAVMTLEPGAPGTPTQALISSDPDVAADKVRLLSARYGSFERTRRGHDHDLYELVRR